MLGLETVLQLSVAQVAWLLGQPVEARAALQTAQALVERCRHLTDQRNEFVHSVWAKQLDGEPLRSDPREGWVPIPSKEQLDQLSEKVMRLTHEINYERLEGFLYQALKK